MRVAHVNLNCRDADLVCRFMLDVLGFRLTDETKRAYFVRCDRYHSSLVLTRAAQATLNHVAFEVPDLDSVMCGAGRMRDNGYPIEWGVGRHGPGNNVFAYFLGPDELPIEYTAGTIEIPDDHEPRGPEYWTWPPGRTDRWGVSPPVSKRFERIQSMFEFPKSAYDLSN
jgi:catechol 2,3-dioxygenase